MQVGLWGAVARGADAVPDADAVRRRYSDFYTAIPKSGYLPKSDPKQVDLGRRLFFERALSADRARSCNDCHDLSKYGTNGAAAIRARDAGALRRDVPSVYNISTLTLMRWVGVRSDLRTQIGASLLSPAESGMESEAAVVDRLENLPTYTARFEKAFGDEGDAITFDRVVDALLAFQKGLVTRAPFDEFLLGEDDALTAQQLRGAILFDVKNCSACHTGQAIGGQMLQKAGIVIPWPNQKDTGYFEETGVEAHKMVFRVPPLRNVAETAPYFHDHSATSLRRAIRDIALHEQGINLEFGQMLQIEAFLKSFTGKLPTEYIAPPKD